MNRYFILFIYFFLFSITAQSQTLMHGSVTDAITHEALPGTIITTNNGTQVPVDAKGSFAVPVNVTSLKFAKVGYNSHTVNLTEIKFSQLNITLMPSSVDLQPVIVSASREGQARQDAPMAISKINSVQIQDTKATALYQLLNKVSGVYMVNLGNEQHTMAIRQPITYNALYLYMEDGVPIRPTGIFNHNALYEINMSGVKDIEVIKGPASSLYGSNSIGGAINFITQGPPSGYAGNFSIQGDNYNYSRIDAGGGFTSAKFGLYVGGYIAKQKDGWQDYSDFDKYSVNFKTTYDFNSKTKLTTTAAYNYLNTQTPGSLDATRFYSRNYGSNNRFTYRRVEAFRASANLQHNWNDKSSSFLTLFYRTNTTAQLPSYYISDVRVAGNYVSSNGQVNDQRFNSYGLLTQHRMDFDFLNSRLIVGAYLDNSPSSFYAQYLNINKDVANNYYTGFTNTGVYIDDYRIKLFNTAAYTQYQMNPVAPLKIVLGLRYDRVHYNFTNGLPATNTKYKQQETNNFNILAPKIGLTYDLGSNKGLYANYSVGFQPPETNGLYSSRQLSPLKQATFNNYEVGGWLSALDKKMFFELTLYSLEGKNEIITQLLPDNTTQNQNAGATRHRGVEYSFTYAPVNSLSFRFGGTNARHTYIDYSEVVSGTNVSYNGKTMNNAPNWIANSEITYKPNYFKGFRIAAEWQHLDGFFTNPANTKSYSGYNIYNLRMGYNFKNKVIKGAGIWFNALNVANALYATNVVSNQYGDTYTAAPPRVFTLGISYSFSKY